MTKGTRVGPSPAAPEGRGAVPAARLRGEDPDDIVAAIAPCDVRGSLTPDVAVVEPAVDALDLWSAGGV